MPKDVASAPSRDELRNHLVRCRLAGRVATPRHSNVRHYQALADGDPHYLFGLRPCRAWTYPDVLDLMAKRVGVDPDPDRLTGDDTIDPDHTIDALDAAAGKLAEFADRGGRVLVATGHPEGLLGMYATLLDALRRRGCRPLTPADGWSYVAQRRRSSEPSRANVGYVQGVAALYDDGEPVHTHSSEPMRALLDALDRDAEPPPDLVIADHGWAGAAGEAGIETIGFADCNDPGLFVGEAENKIAVAVPLDDNVDPTCYDVIATYLLRWM